MINVLYIMSNLDRQGPVFQLLYLCRYLDRKEIKPIVLLTSKQESTDSLINDFKNIEIEVIELNLSKIKSIFTARKRIQSIIDHRQIDIIQSFGFRSDFISCKLKRVFKITSVRNTVLYNYEIVFGKYLGFVLGKAYLHFNEKFNLVIACSESIRKYLHSINIKSITIRNSIDYRAISYIKRESSDLKTFITVSSKAKGKNVEFILDIFSEKLCNYQLIIIGYVESYIIEKYKKRSNIIFKGKVNNALEEYNNATYFISASLHEGLPNAVIESLAVGTPVLLSDIPSHAEILGASDQKAGVIFKNNNIEDLLCKIEEICNKYDYNELEKNCKQLIINNFDSKNMAAQYLVLYKQFININ